MTPICSLIPFTSTGCRRRPAARWSGSAVAVVALVVILAAPTVAAMPADEVAYSIDPAHSRVGFGITHLGFTTVNGSFGEFSGTVRMEPGDLETLHLEGTIDAASIDTGVESRDGHLRSADFFDVERYPEIRFVSDRAEDLGDGRFRLHGDLTMHGVSRPIVLEGQYGGEVSDPWGNVRAVFAATTTVSREAFGITWNQTLESGILRLSDEVEIELAAEAIRQDGES